MDADRTTSTFGSNWMCAAVLSVLLAYAPWLAHAQTRFELRPLETVTLSTQQLLLGEKNGKPVMLAEELRIPKPGTDRLPAQKSESDPPKYPIPRERSKKSAMVVPVSVVATITAQYKKG